MGTMPDAELAERLRRTAKSTGIGHQTKAIPRAGAPTAGRMDVPLKPWPSSGAERVAIAAMADWLLLGPIGLAILAVATAVVWFYGSGQGPHR